MKKVLSVILCFALILSNCIFSFASELSTEQEIENNSNSAETESGANWFLPAPSLSKNNPVQSNYHGLDDPQLLSDMEDNIYMEVSRELQPEGYYVDNVSTSYISKEYIEELEYNSKINIFYGYTLDELEKQFQGTKYVFTLGDNGETEVVPFESYDDTYEKVLKNVAIGTGVILICVTVSVATAGVGAPAVSMIFTASAKTGAIMGAMSGSLEAVISGTVTGVKTGDFKKALKAAALAGSEGFKWGAITGAVSGGTSELVMLKSATQGGLTMDEVTTILKETKLPANFLKQLHSMDEYHEVVDAAKRIGVTTKEFANMCLSTDYPIDIVKYFRTADESAVYYDQIGLVAENIDGKPALIRSIDLSYKSELGGKTVTNLERMQKGAAAIDPATGEPYVLHHIGQNVDSPFAILTKAEHTGSGNYSVLHDVNIPDGEGVHALLSNSDWGDQRAAFWKAVAALLG